ncbi:hypothetical protein KA078_01775 [Candidatus Woesebacteria bacterium]|nr:hypothetical protein [Candidatus Woesebacteria bacterium]
MSTVQNLARSRRNTTTVEEPPVHQKLPRFHFTIPPVRVLLKDLPHVKYLHLLLLAGLSTASFIYFCVTIPPSAVANILFYHSYLPFIALFFVMIFFISSFLLLHTRRGFLCALYLTLLIFFKLQEVALTAGVYLVPLFILGSIECASLLAIKK